MRVTPPPTSPESMKSTAPEALLTSVGASQSNCCSSYCKAGAGSRRPPVSCVLPFIFPLRFQSWGD